MKKIVFFVFAAVLPMFWLSLSAQEPFTCRDVVLPMVGGSVERVDQYPVEKLEWHCQFSRNSMYVSDTMPADAVVYDISEVKDLATGKVLPADYVVNLDRMSFYAFSFNDFRHRHYHSQIYFRTPASEHPYLVLRTYDEALRMTNRD